MFVCFFFQAEDGIRDIGVTGVQTCALPISAGAGAIALLAYTGIAFLERQYDVAIICGAMVGAIIGFLWYNAHPADIFMRSEERRVGKECRSRWSPYH